jgi:hypothetical protein
MSIFNFFNKKQEKTANTTTTETQQQRVYNIFNVNPELRASIKQIRHMDRIDPRVKKIHSRTARAAVKGGIKLNIKEDDIRIKNLFDAFVKNTKLNNRQKLESDARALMIEGSLVLQLINQSNNIIALPRLPSDSIVPIVQANGQFKKLNHAYEQFDFATQKATYKFALWEITIARLNPENFDDNGAMGRPYLDATRGVWKKLIMTEEDLVLRRRYRAPQRLVHILEGASEEELKEYESKNKIVTGNIITDFFSNKKGSVSALSGDANLDQIADIAYLLDTFFAGSPAPKGLFGYAGDLSRDILEDLKRDFFDELDSMQDIIASCYQQAFDVFLLLQGINIDNYNYNIEFAERKTETPNQAVDRALKLNALGMSRRTCIETAGGNYDKEVLYKKQDDVVFDAYPTNHKVSITDSNAKKNESATSISNG